MYCRTISRALALALVSASSTSGFSVSPGQDAFLRRQLAITDGTDHAIDIAAIFGKRQQDGAIQNLGVLMDSSARSFDRLFLLLDLFDVFCGQFQQSSLNVFTDPPTLLDRLSRLPQLNPDMGKTGILGVVAQIDDEAEIPVIAELGPVDVAAPGQGRPAAGAPFLLDARGQPTLEIVFDAGHERHSISFRAAGRLNTQSNRRGLERS